VGDRIVFDAEGALHVAKLTERPKWERFSVGSEAVVSYATTGAGLVAQLESGRLAILDESFKEKPLAPKSVTGDVRAMAASEDFAGFLEGGGEFAVLDANGWRQGPLRGGLGRTWEVQSLDRAGANLVATSESSLFVSPDLGQRWRRIGPARGARVWARPGGGQVVFGSRLQWELDVETDSVGELVGLEEFAPDHVERRGERWLAWGTWRRADENGHFVVSSHTPSVGEEFMGVVACSLDAGRSWTVVDRVEDAGIQALQWTDDDRLELLLDGGGFRRGVLDLDGWWEPEATIKTVLEPSLERLSGRPRVDWMSWLFFASDNEGWAGGQKFYGGGVEYHTEDGGLHWSLVPGRGEEGTEILHPAEGLWLKPEYPRSFFVWRDGWSADFPQLPMSGEIALGSVKEDSKGGLLVRLESGETWSLPLDGEAWERLW